MITLSTKRIKSRAQSNSTLARPSTHLSWSMRPAMGTSATIRIVRAPPTLSVFKPILQRAIQHMDRLPARAFIRFATKIIRRVMTKMPFGSRQLKRATFADCCISALILIVKLNQKAVAFSSHTLKISSWHPLPRHSYKVTRHRCSTFGQEPVGGKKTNLKRLCSLTMQSL